MTNKLSYSSSWQFVFWDNEWSQVSLQQKYIDALHVYVLKHSLTPCKSNRELSIFIQFAMNIFYKVTNLSFSPWTPLYTDFFPNRDQFRVVLLFSSNAFFSDAWSHHNGGIISFTFQALRK